jgi:hypothetical protein
LTIRAKACRWSESSRVVPCRFASQWGHATQEHTSALWARWLPPALAAALVAAVVGGAQIWVTHNLAREQLAQKDRLELATRASEAARLEQEGSIARREQQLALLGIVAERLLNPDAAVRKRAVQLLEVIDSEFARRLAGLVARRDESPAVKAAARRIAQLVCTDAAGSPMSGQTFDEAKARLQCTLSIPSGLKRGGVWRTRLDNRNEVWCTCVNWGESATAKQERRESNGGN